MESLIYIYIYIYKGMFECKLKLKIKRNLILRKASNSDNKTSTQQILGKRREELQGAELYIYS